MASNLRDFKLWWDFLYNGPGRAQCKAAVAVVVTSVSAIAGGTSGWQCRILRQPVAPELAHSMLPLKILPSWVNLSNCQVSRAILALGLLTVIVSGQQQRRVIGFDAEGRITIQVQYKSGIINRLFR